MDGMAYFFKNVFIPIQMYICIAFQVFESVILLNKFGSFMDGTVDGSEIQPTS